MPKTHMTKFLELEIIASENKYEIQFKYKFSTKKYLRICDPIF